MLHRNVSRDRIKYNGYQFPRKIKKNQNCLIIYLSLLRYASLLCFITQTFGFFTLVQPKYMSGPGSGQLRNPFANPQRYPHSDYDADSDLSHGYGSPNASTTRLAGNQPYNDQHSEYFVSFHNCPFSSCPNLAFITLFFPLHFSTFALSPQVPILTTVATTLILWTRMGALTQPIWMQHPPDLPNHILPGQQIAKFLCQWKK